MFVKIGGVPASGKTTIAKLLVDVLRVQGYDADEIHGGDIMAEILGVSMNELHKLPEAVRNSVRPEMYRRMYEEDLRNPSKIWIRDAHFCLYEPLLGSFTICPLQKGDRQQMKAMFILHVSPEEIRKRRLLEKNPRSDRALDLGIIQKEIEQEIDIAKKQALELSIPLVIINNYARIPRDACDEIFKKLEGEIFLDLKIKPKKVPLERKDKV